MFINGTICDRSIPKFFLYIFITFVLLFVFKIDYFNNKVICDLIEQNHKGILSIMDEGCRNIGKVSDEVCKDTVTSVSSVLRNLVAFSQI